MSLSSLPGDSLAAVAIFAGPEGLAALEMCARATLREHASVLWRAVRAQHEDNGLGKLSDKTFCAVRASAMKLLRGPNPIPSSRVNEPALWADVAVTVSLVWRDAAEEHRVFFEFMRAKARSASEAPVVATTLQRDEKSIPPSLQAFLRRPIDEGGGEICAQIVVTRISDGKSARFPDMNGAWPGDDGTLLKSHLHGPGCAQMLSFRPIDTHVRHTLAFSCALGVLFDENCESLLPCSCSDEVSSFLGNLPLSLPSDLPADSSFMLLNVNTDFSQFDHVGTGNGTPGYRPAYRHASLSHTERLVVLLHDMIDAQSS